MLGDYMNNFLLVTSFKELGLLLSKNEIKEEEKCLNLVILNDCLLFWNYIFGDDSEIKLLNSKN